MFLPLFNLITFNINYHAKCVRCKVLHILCEYKIFILSFYFLAYVGGGIFKWVLLVSFSFSSSITPLGSVLSTF